MARIFISYRRADSTVYVKLIHDRLTQQFGRKAVFMDEEQIDLGDEFARFVNSRRERGELEKAFAEEFLEKGRGYLARAASEEPDA